MMSLVNYIVSLITYVYRKPISNILLQYLNKAKKLRYRHSVHLVSFSDIPDGNLKDPLQLIFEQNLLVPNHVDRLVIQHRA